MSNREDTLALMKATLASIGGSGSGKVAQQRMEEPKVALRTSRVPKKNSRSKGSRGELNVAKLITEWWGELLRRTPNSGGLHIPGDITPANSKSLFPFHVEIKNREDWRLDDLITGLRDAGSRSVREWWEQAASETPRGKMPLLVFRQNRMRCHLAMMRDEHFAKLDSDGQATIALPTFRYYFEGLPKGSGAVVIFSLEKFFGIVRPPKGSPNRKGWTSVSEIDVEDDNA